MKEYFSARSLEARADNAAPPDHDAVHLKPFFTYPEDREKLLALAAKVEFCDNADAI